MYPAKRLDLHWLHDQDGETRRPQMHYHAAFIATRRFDTDADDTGLGKAGSKRAPTRQGICDLPTVAALVNRDVEFKFGSIDSSVVMLTCVIFFDPAL
jgi:hypothetical protein